MLIHNHNNNNYIFLGFYRKKKSFAYFYCKITSKYIKCLSSALPNTDVSVTRNTFQTLKTIHLADISENRSLAGEYFGLRK